MGSSYGSVRRRRRRLLVVLVVLTSPLLLLGVIFVGSSLHLWETFEAGEEVSFETADVEPAWSPDGRLIAFSSSRAGGGIYVIDPSGRRLRRLFAGDAGDLEWSPDGKQLVFMGSDGISLVPAGGRGAVREILHGRMFSLPAWARDGRLAIVKEERDLSCAIYTVGLDGSGLERLLPVHRGPVGEARPGSSFARSETEPAWSPDGRSIAFQAGDGQIVTSSIDGGPRREVAAEGAYEPAWSPDGRLIAYQCEGDVCVANADGSGGARRLAGDGGAPSWAPDSRRLVFEHYLYNNKVWGSAPRSLSIVDVTDGRVRKLTFGE